jgi:peptide subunit release factor 1 (eRF1)
MLVGAMATLEQLLAMEPGRHWIASCYLRLLPQDRARDRYLIQLKSHRKSLARQLDEMLVDKDERYGVEHDLDELVAYVSEPTNLPRAGGLAVFASAPLDLFAAVPMPRVYRPRLVVDHSPAVRELVAAQADFGRVVAVVLDRSRARLFAVDASGAYEIVGFPAVGGRGARFHADRRGAPGSGEHGYHRRREEEIARHFKSVIEHLVARDRSEPIQGFVLAGPPHRVRAFRQALPNDLASRVLGRAALSPRMATPASVFAAVLDVRAEHEASVAHDAVAEMLVGIGEGWAVRGVGPTLTALVEGRLRALLVGAIASASGFRCVESGRLVVEATMCRGPMPPVPVVDVIDEAVEEALRQELTLTLVQAPADSEAVQGLAGVLRYR